MMRSEEFVEQLIERDPIRIRVDAVCREESSDELSADVVFDAARGEREIAIAVRNAGATDVDETGDAIAVDHDVRQAVIAVRDDEVLGVWPRRVELRQQFERGAADSAVVEVRLVDP